MEQVTEQTPRVANDLPDREEIPMSNGNFIRVERKDPYGHYHLSLNSGNLPDPFNGAYTGRAVARQAALEYLSTRNLTPDAHTRPVLKLKPGYEKKD